MKKSSPFEDGLGPAAVYFAFRAGARLAEQIPIGLGNVIADAGGTMFYWLSSKKKRTVERNLARVAGEGPHLKGLVKSAFRSYARYWLETFRLGGYSKEDLLSMVESDSVQVIEEALASGKGLVIATAHFGFYDIGVAWVGAKGYPLTTVGEVLRPRALFEWFAKIREQRGMKILPARPGAEARKRLIATVEGGEGVALLSDRDLGRRGVWVEFFGERTTFPVGPALVVAHTGATLVAGAIYSLSSRSRENRYRVDFEGVPYERTGDERRDVEAIAQTIAGAVEMIVRKAPEQWHLFSTNWPSDEPHLPPRGPAEEPVK